MKRESYAKFNISKKWSQWRKKNFKKIGLNFCKGTAYKHHYNLDINDNSKEMYLWENEKRYSIPNHLSNNACKI